MPLDVRGRTCATMNGSACVSPGPKGSGNPLNPIRTRDWGLQLFPMNEEFPVGASHQLASITSLPFVHTARRYYRSLQLMSSSDWTRGPASRRAVGGREDAQIDRGRGRKSRNKVSVGEPADGSLPNVASSANDSHYRVGCERALTQSHPSCAGSPLSPYMGRNPGSLPSECLAADGGLRCLPKTQRRGAHDRG